MQPPAPPPAPSHTRTAPVPPLVCTGNYIILPCSVTIVEYNSKKIYHTYQKQKKERKKQDGTCQNEKTLTYPYGFTVYLRCFVDTTVLRVQVLRVRVRVGPRQPMPDPCATLLIDDSPCAIGRGPDTDSGPRAIDRGTDTDSECDEQSHRSA